MDFSEELMHVHLTDGRVVSVPLIWFPSLHTATPEQRQRCQIRASGRALRWPDLDEDLSIAGLLAGAEQQAA
jgi:hypothetical protein